MFLFCYFCHSFCFVCGTLWRMLIWVLKIYQFVKACFNSTEHCMFICTCYIRCCGLVFTHVFMFVSFQTPHHYDSGFASLQASPILPTSPPAGQTVGAPSNTLFVTNIGPFCLDQELNDLFASFHGFIRLRRTKQPVQLQNGGQSFCAFVEYQVKPNVST